MAAREVKGFAYSDVHPVDIARRLKSLAKEGVRVEMIGRSRSGAWPIYGAVLGDDGKPTVAITGNNHAEEVIGTLTILRLIEECVSGGPLARLLEEVRLVVIPQMNPDGVVNNWKWLSDPTPVNRLAFERRDHREEDVEHGIAVDDKPFVRPEPQSLVSFYERFAKDVAAYFTLHSSTLETGAYFLTGNEDEGVMRPAFDLIRDVAPSLGLPLKNEDTNGCEGYRRLAPGVYNIPRYAEMVEKLREAGKAHAKFLLNSFEWMEGRGSRVNLVSEVPTVVAETYTEESVHGVSAVQFGALQIPYLEKAVDGRRTLLEDLDNLEAGSKVSDPGRLQWFREEFEKSSSRAVHRLCTDMIHLIGQPGLRVHQAQVVEIPYRWEIEGCGLAVSVLSEGPESERYAARLADAGRDLMINIRPRMTPISTQIRLQTLLILAGTRAALAAGR